MRLGMMVKCALIGMGALFFSSVADARRTAVDQDADGNPAAVTLEGYCDRNGDECNPVSDGARLTARGQGYRVGLGDGFTDRVFVQGNGVLTFGAPAFDPVCSPGAPCDRIVNFLSVNLLDYGRTLVSPGQSNDFVFDSFFDNPLLQSGSLSIGANGSINAEWYTCQTPIFCFENPHSLTLVPVFGGYQGTFDFSLGAPTGTLDDPLLGDQRGYVIGGVFTPVAGDTFFLPATFQNLAVPEPSTWAMMIGGIGAVGGVMRRARRSAANGTATA